MNRLQRWLSKTRFIKRLLELDILLRNAAVRASLARRFSLTNIANHHIINHRVDIVLFNKKKYWWMRRQKFKV